MSLGCAAGSCGRCCDPVRLPAEVALRLEAPGNTGSDARFANEHWEMVGFENGNVLFKCDQYDPGTRLCTAHDSRPPICSGYPFYGRGPNPVDLGSGFIYEPGPDGLPGLACSYLLDIPPAWRPPGTHPLIPIEPA